MRRSAIAAIGVMVVSAATGCGAAVFECASAEDCIGGRAEGMCQPDGFCSFADATCPSGQRYGERAPSGIANECVDLELDDSTSDPSTDTFASATNTDGDSMTSTSAMTSSTTTDGTSTTTTDPTMPMTTSDATMTTSDPVTTSPTTDSMTDTSNDPVCGDGIVDVGEDCDGQELGGLDCTSFDFDDGELTCGDDCKISTAGCSNCMMGCGETCTDRNDCSDTQSCVMGAGAVIGSCWPDCMSDMDCDGRFMGSLCYLLESGPACLFPCDMTDVCPDGLECTALESMDLACL